jgi:hypothetical protein
MNKSVDLAQIRSALEGRQLLGFKLDPIKGLVLSADKSSKTGRSKAGGVKVGAVKFGFTKQGITKKGLTKL